MEISWSTRGKHVTSLAFLVFFHTKKFSNISSVNYVDVQGDMQRLAIVRKRREEAQQRKAEEEAAAAAEKEKVADAAKALATAGPEKLNPLEARAPP